MLSTKQMFCPSIKLQFIKVGHRTVHLLGYKGPLSQPVTAEKPNEILTCSKISIKVELNIGHQDHQRAKSAMRMTIYQSFYSFTTSIEKQYNGVKSYSRQYVSQLVKHFCYSGNTVVLLQPSIHLVYQKTEWSTFCSQIQKALPCFFFDRSAASADISGPCNLPSPCYELSGIRGTHWALYFRSNAGHTQITIRLVQQGLGKFQSMYR